MAARWYEKIRDIYSLRYILLNVLIAAVYYKLISIIIAAQQFGVVLYSVPIALVYLLVATTSMLMTIAIHTLLNSRRNRQYHCAVSSAATTFLGGVIGGCGCQAAFLSSALAIVLGTGEATLLNTIVAEHLVVIFAAMALVNIVLIVRSLNNISDQKVRKKG